jgi:hypothetical protein
MASRTFGKARLTTAARSRKFYAAWQSKGYWRGHGFSGQPEQNKSRSYHGMLQFPP